MIKKLMILYIIYNIESDNNFILTTIYIYIYNVFMNIFRKFIFLTTFFIIFTSFILPVNIKGETNLPTRVINVVFDDSGSMIRDSSGKYVDTWCQAKYAMEVFASMLGEKDTLNIYYMSDYHKNSKYLETPPKLTLKGNKSHDGAQKNVNKIHEIVTDCAGTPFDSVKKAHEDLKNINADEKWLVIVTDGGFDSTSNSTVQNYLYDAATNDNMKIMMLGVGAEAAEIQQDESKGVFFVKAATSNDILRELTDICNRIFQNNNLQIIDNSISFNVPMSEIIVFAQGKDAKINGIYDSNNNLIKPSANTNALFSSEATIDANYPKDRWIIDDDLVGWVASFNNKFNPGTYKIDVAGADSVDVYYKPNVTIEIYLYDGDKEVTSEKLLTSGNYKVQFGFVNADTGEKVEDTSLLGNIEYNALIKNISYDGNENTKAIKPGDTVELKEGSISVDVDANFLEYNTVRSHLDYNVYSNNTLVFKEETNKSYTLTSEGFKDTSPVKLRVKLFDGNNEKDLTEKQWELLELGKLENYSNVGLTIEKGNEKGIILVKPSLYQDDPFKTDDGIIDYSFDASFNQEQSSSSGNYKGQITINKEISFIDWIKQNLTKIIIFSAILFVVLGYIPGIKKYLSREIKRNPLTIKKDLRGYDSDKPVSNKSKRTIKPLSTIFPYVPEQGNIRVSSKIFSVVAVGGGDMKIKNFKAVINNDKCKINGSVCKKKPPIIINPRSRLSSIEGDYEYMCTLNKKAK